MLVNYIFMIIVTPKHPHRGSRSPEKARNSWVWLRPTVEAAETPRRTVKVGFPHDLFKTAR